MLFLVFCFIVAPSRARGLKQFAEVFSSATLDVAPSRARGLKQAMLDTVGRQEVRRAFTGAWIETA